MRTLSDMLELKQIGTPGAYSTEVNGAWISAEDYRRVLFIVNVGDLTDDCVFTVKQATDDEGAGAKNLDATVTATATDTEDESKPGYIEVLTDHMDDGFPYITLAIAPAASVNLSIVALLGEGYEIPASNSGVAFNVKSQPA